MYRARRRPSRNPGSGGTTPMFAATGSTMTAAIVSPRSAKTFPSASTSLNGTVSVSRAAPSVTPGEPGIPNVATPLPRTLREQRVRVPVVAALELHDEVAPGEASRQADRAHRRFGPARDEPDHLDRRHRGRDPFGELDLALGRRAERGPARRRLPGRLDDLGSRVTEQQRAPRLHEVDVPVAVGVDHVGALASNREPRGPAHGAERPHRRVHAAGDHAPGALEQLLGSGHDRVRKTASRPRPSRGT